MGENQGLELEIDLEPSVFIAHAALNAGSVLGRDARKGNAFMRFFVHDHPFGLGRCRLHEQGKQEEEAEFFNVPSYGAAVLFHVCCVLC